MGAGLKRCWKCETWKPTADYTIDRSRGDGLNSLCVACDRVQVRAEPYFKRGAPSLFKGRKHTPASRALMSSKRIGNKNAVGHVKTPAQWAVVHASAARPRSAKGPANSRWKGGVTPQHILARRSPAYAAWRLAVFTRDRFTCRRCGDARGGNLHAHHVKSFSEHPELRFNVDNGATLCEPCHEMEHFKPGSTRNLAKARRAAAA